LVGWYLNEQFFGGGRFRHQPPSKHSFAHGLEELAHLSTVSQKENFFSTAVIEIGWPDLNEQFLEVNVFDTSLPASANRIQKKDFTSLLSGGKRKFSHRSKFAKCFHPVTQFVSQPPSHQSATITHHISLRCFWRNVSSKCLEFGGSHVTATRHVRVSRLSSITDNTIRSQWLRHWPPNTER
jgi:hypothetical protein